MCILRGKRGGNESETCFCTFWGGRYHYVDAFGLASLQRVYCSSHSIKRFLPEKPVVVDVGANCGQFNHFSRYYLNASRVISIEPEKESYRLLQRNGADPSDCLPCAISNKAGEIPFHVARETSQLSSYIFEDGVSYKDQYLVPCHSLDDIAAELQIGWVDLLKIDTEGSELDVLKSAEDLLSRTNGIMIELSIFRNCAGNLFMVGEFLQSRGFVLSEFHCGSGRIPKDADAVFLRP